VNSPFHPKTIQVPGILSDDALQEQLKQFANSKNALQDAAPPPNSAVDFADKIQSEFLDKKAPAIRAPQAPPAVTPERQKQDKAIDVRSNVLSEGAAAIEDPTMRTLLLGPAIGLLGEGGLVNKLGTLDSPEARQAEAESRAVDAAKAEAAAKTDANMREEMRNVIDGDQTPEGIRAVLMGEPDPIGPIIAEQNKTSIAEASAKRKEAVEALTDPTKQPTQKWWLDAMQRGAAAAYDVPVSALKAPLIAWEMTRDMLFLGNDEKSTARAWADTVDATLTKMLPGDKTRAKDFVSKLSAGGGSLLGFMMAGWAARAVGLPGEVATMIAGSTNQATQQFEEAEQFNAVGLQKYMSFILGGAIGLTEAIPVNTMLFKLDNASGGAVQRLLTRTAAGSIEEFLQEAGQTFGEDVVAKLLYDSKRDFDVNRYLEAGLIGGITGGMAGAAASVLHETGVTGDMSPPDYVVVTPQQREAAAMKTIEALDQEFEALPGLPEATAQSEAARVLGTEGTLAPIDVRPNIAPPVKDAKPVQPVVEGPGGTIPVREDGKMEITHWSSKVLDVVDPARRGTGPLKGVERSRLGTPGSDPNVVDRSYYGVGDPAFSQRFAAENAKLPPRQRGVKAPTDPYHGEGLGPYQHTVAVDPNTMYNWYQDPLNLKAQLDRSTPATEQVTKYEKLIKDAGFKGAYFSESRLGQTAVLFEAAKPERVVDQRYGMPVGEIATPADFSKPTAKTFSEKGGWAVVTATQEAVGPATAPENVAANEKLRAELTKKKIPYQEVGGSYQGVDQGKSFLVFMPEAEAIKLGKKYKQESVLTRKGLEYADGRLVPAVPDQTVVGDAARKGDFFSTLPNGEAFAVGLDFNAPTLNRETGLIDNFKVPTTAEIKAIELGIRDLAPLPGLTNSPGPVEIVVQAARAYAQARGLPVRRQAEYVKADPERGKRIADAYEKMKHAPDNPKVKAAYQAMADETLAQYQFVKATGLKVEAIEPGMPDPYPGGPKEVLADLQKGHLWFFPTESGFGSLTDIQDNPLLAPTDEFIGDRQLLVNDVFRIVHDFFGHGLEGAGFGARGEENAWQSHMRLFSGSALPAVTSETRGQNSWVNFGPYGEANRNNQRETVYADQKTGIMPSWTWTEGVADDGRAAEEADLLANIQAPARVEKLLDQIPGLKGVAVNMTADERAKLSKANAQKIVDIFTKLPDPKEMAAVAISGRAKRGWYKRSAEALVDIFGLQDAPRFAGLLAALSPQTSVENNAINALYTWTNWIKAERPTDRKKIMAILGQSVQGGRGEASVLPAWVNNAVTALTEPDAMNITLSGPKVDSFMKNLQGVVVEVTNDAWMANFANIDQSLFAKSGAVPGKGAGYIAMSAAVRDAAKAATKMTGETWTPAEIQETVWSWAKTLYEKASAAGENRTAAQIIAAGDMTAEEIGATPDFASLFVSGVYRNILEKGGYDVERLAKSSGERDGGDVRRGRPTSAEGTGIAQRTFDRHLKRAAERLDALRARRKAEEDRGPTFTLAETFDQGGPAPDPLGHLSEADRAFLDEQMLANRGTGNRAPLKGEQTRPAQGIAANPNAPQAETVDVTLAKISQDVVKLLDATARQGRLTIKGKGVLGQYSRKQDVVRVKTMSDLSTVVHEGGHALYFDAGPALAKVIQDNEAVVMQAATDLYGGDVAMLPRKEHIAEGFAEFFRVYVLHRQFAETKYPKLTADFTAALQAEAPTLLPGLDIVRKKFEAWLQLPSAQLVKNKIVSGKQDGKFTAAIKELQDAGFPTWMHEVARKTVETSINRYAGFNDIVSQILNKGQENAGKALDVKRADDPRILLRLAANSGARAMIEATDGVIGYRSVQSSTRGLRDALLISQGRRVDQNLGTIDPIRQQDFAAYLVALRGIDEYRRLAEGKLERPPFDDITLGDLHITVKELNDIYGTDFVRAAEIVNEYGMGLWKKSYDAGLMSKETYTNGLDRKFYAPLQRDMSDKKKSLGPSALTQGASIVKRFRGSGRDIIDPMDVLMHKTFALEKIIAKNDAMKALATLADRAGKVGALVERVPAQQLIGKQFSVKEIARQLTKDDTISETDAEDLMTILQASIEDDSVLSLFRSEQASTKGENIVFFWDSGRLAALQLADGDLGADVVNTLNGVGRENLPMFVDLIAATSTAFRAAITSWPDFLAVNFIRDQLSAFILTDVGFKPFYTGIKGTFDELRQRQWAKQYNAAMGIMGGMNVATLHNARVNRDIGALRKKGYLAKAFSGGGMLGAVKGMANIAELTETGTRIGIYKSAFERAKKDGLNDYEASIEAGYTATDYMDFGLNGSKMLLWRRTIPFLNAQLQGLYKMMRTLGADEVRQRKGLMFVLKSYLKSTKNLDLSRTEKLAINTGRKAWVKMMSLGLLSAALHFLFEDDPDYQEAGEYLRTTGWVIPTGDGKVFYIPKPFELAVFANFVERGLEAANGDQSAKGRFMRGLAMNLVPPTSPPAIQIGVELAANYDFFADREIVPSYMQALSPELQFNNYTSELAKSIGQATGVSPMVLDHIMSGLGASAYRDMSTMTNALDPNRPNMDATDAPILRRFVRDVRRGSASSKDFWGIASTLNGSLRRAETTYKAYLEAGNENAANAFLATLDEDDRAYALLTTHFKADAKKLNPFYRGRQLTTIVSAMRREMVSPLGMEDTTTKAGGEIKLTSREKADLDEALSEYARREMRNTLIAMGAPGWAGKKPLDAQSTVDLITSIEPRAGEELQRRIKKAGVYSFDTVNTYWPEVKDRLLRDHENTFLKDILTIAKVMR